MSFDIDIKPDRRTVPIGEKPGLTMVFGKIVGRHVGSLVLPQPHEQVDRFLV